MDNKDILDDSIKDLIGDSTNLDEESDNLDLPVRTRKSSKYTNIRRKAKGKAKSTLNTLLRFYLSEELIANEDYIRAKTHLEKMTLTKLIYMMETGEKAITTLMEQIDNNNMSPRMFEVLGTLQKSLLDIIKAQNTYMIATEESVKRLARDVDIYSANKPEKQTAIESSKDDIFSGTKKLMQTVQAEIKNEKTGEFEELNTEE